MWKINGHPRLFKTLMSLQVLGWVFSTWSLMVEVCHLLVMNTFSGVFDQNLSRGFLYDGSRTLTFSAAECLEKYILFKVKRIVDYEGNIKVVHTACAVHIFNPVFNCEVASGGKRSVIFHVSSSFQLLAYRMSSVEWLESSSLEFIHSAVNSCKCPTVTYTLTQIKVQFSYFNIKLIYLNCVWKQATPETTTIAHN